MNMDPGFIRNLCTPGGKVQGDASFLHRPLAIPTRIGSGGEMKIMVIGLQLRRGQKSLKIKTWDIKNFEARNANFNVLTWSCLI